MPKLAQLHLNGKHTDESPQSLIAADLRREMVGTDDITIGNQLPVPGKEDEGFRGATMADAAKLVAGVMYLVKCWIAFGMVTGVVAEPGVGKSAFVLWLARTVMLACKWFNGMTGPGQPGYVLWLATENDMAITLDRMQKWKIPMDRLILPFAHDPLFPVNLTDAEHLALIERLINKYQTRLVVVDSLRGGHSGDENNSQVGAVLQDLAKIAERTRAAIVVVHHTRKLMVEEEVTANSSRGSNAILALMRSQLGIDRPDPKSKRCRVRVLKENLGIAPPAIGFEVTATGLVFGPPPVKPPPDNSRAPQRADAKKWLWELLKDGPVAAHDVWAKAEADGLCQKTVKAAKKELGVETKKSGGTGAPWMWALPKSGTQE